MRFVLILAALLCAPVIIAYAEIQQDVVERDTIGGTGSGGGGDLSAIDIDTFSELDAIVADESLVNLNDSQILLNKAIDGNSNTVKMLRHTTDCTAYDGAVDGQYCWEQDDNILYVCETADVCDTAGEWDAVASGAIDSVFGRTGAVTAATSDYDAVQIDNTPAGNIAAINVQAAIAEVDSEKAALAGATFTGQIVSANTGVEFTESDTNPTCSAGNYNAFADLSETAVKVCNNGTAEQVTTPNNTQTLKNKTLNAADNVIHADDALDLSCSDCVALTSETSGNYVANVATTSPISGGSAGSEAASITLTIADSAADGSTKGAASFTAADFNTTSGNVSLDYTNGQAASGSNKGFLTSADWTTFNSKMDRRKHLVELRPQSAEPPSSSFATLNTRNSHPALRFNGNVCDLWSFVLPNFYGGNGTTVDIWVVSTETTNNTAWNISWERIEASQDIDSDGFASAVSSTGNNNNATSGIATKVSVAFTDGAQMDSCAANELCRIKICRDDTTDTGGADTIDYIGGQIRETP